MQRQDQRNRRDDDIQNHADLRPIARRYHPRIQIFRDLAKLTRGNECYRSAQHQQQYPALSEKLRWPPDSG